MISVNRKAHYEYEILDQLEVGLVLKGIEVKTIRNQGLPLSGTYAIIENNEVWLVGCFDRKIKLLMHRHEINKLEKKPGTTLIPIDSHFKGEIIKLTLAIAKGKKKYDKRESIKKRDITREKE